MVKESSNGVDNSPVISYLALRKAVGVIGIALPVVLAVGHHVVRWVCPSCAAFRGTYDGSWIQGSISSYYWTAVGDVLVGSLCAIGVFLSSYRGQNNSDRLAGYFACAFAVGVALFPTSPGTHTTVIGTMHYLFAAGLFGTLAYFCLRLFQKPDVDGSPDNLKPTRNRLYFACGVVIVLCIAAIAIVHLLEYIGVQIPDWLAPVFWFEAIAIWAFGWSWLVKGKGLGILQPKRP